MRMVILEKKERLALITLNRPDKLNALNSEAVNALIKAAEEIEKDDDIRVVIITGAGGKAFSSGSDLTELQEITAVELRQRIESPNIIRNLSKPVVAMIQGYALGGGLELALACDIRVASEDAKLGFPEITHGWLPAGGGGTQVLPRLVGEGMAMKLILTGKFISAAEAKQIGLVEMVVPADQLQAETQKLAEDIAEKPVEILRLAKEAIKASVHTNFQSRLNYETALNAICFAIKREEGK
ncbi:MAG: enoyl-CoA hydratase/isomerase family protein [Desulfobacterales bacterium]|nr:MAG: enoyl-CoA hydratase/isomerase family protein [Desulfobacterales bacterium]